MSSPDPATSQCKGMAGEFHKLTEFETLEDTDRNIDCSTVIFRAHSLLSRPKVTWCRHNLHGAVRIQRRKVESGYGELPIDIYSCLMTIGPSCASLCSMDVQKEMVLTTVMPDNRVFRVLLWLGHDPHSCQNRLFRAFNCITASPTALMQTGEEST